MLLPSIITLFIALVAGYLAFRLKQPCYVIIMLFIYTTFHYTYSALPVFFWDETIYMRDYTQNGVKLIGFAFIFYALGLAAWRYRQHLFSKISTRPVKLFSGLFFIWIAAVLFFWVINIINKGIFPGGLAIQDFVSVVLMVISVWIFGTTIHADLKSDFSTVMKYEKFYQSLLIFTILMLIISVIQIVTERSFAGVNLPNGEYLHRACGLMYNPNVLGFWSALAAIIGAYGYHADICRKTVSILIMIFSSACIIISGSRSGMIICLLAITIISIILLYQKNIKVKDIFMPFIIVAGSIVVIISSILLSDKMTGGSNKGIHNLSLLAYRFAIAPVEVMTYINYKITGTENESKNIDYSTTLSIKGRITSSERISPQSTNNKSNDSDKKPSDNALTIGPNMTLTTPGVIPTDNAYIAMYEEFGPASLIVWCIWGIWLIALSIKNHIKNKNIESAYGINLILVCALSGMFMRSFQAFPFWVFNAILLSLSFSIILGNTKNRLDDNHLRRCQEFASNN